MLSEEKGIEKGKKRVENFFWQPFNKRFGAKVISMTKITPHTGSGKVDCGEKRPYRVAWECHFTRLHHKGHKSKAAGRVEGL
jgi:hypothetical protein